MNPEEQTVPEEQTTTETPSETVETPSETTDTVNAAELSDPNAMLDSFVSGEDIIMILGTLVVITLMAFIINRLVIFVAEFMRDFVKKVKNSSMIYSDNHLNKPNLDTDLDRSEFGFKTLMDRWFK